MTLPYLSRALLLGFCALVVIGCSTPDEYHVYWGDVHGHTSISDGKGSLDDYFTHARDVAKLDFAIVTDHDFGNAHPWWMPKEAWKLTQDKANEHTAPGKFVAIAGYEWTSQTKYWTEVGGNEISERLFPGPPRFYNHKNVYFPSRVDYLLCAKDAAYKDPDSLAEAVSKRGGLIHNAHPSSGPDEREQFDYARRHDAVIVNTEMLPDVIRYKGKTHQGNYEQVVREFLDRGGRTGFVAGTDTHEGKPNARTAVLARELTREAVFDALRHRRNYAVWNARIVVDFRIDGHVMGEEIETAGKPRIAVNVKGTRPIAEVIIVRNGAVLHTLSPGRRTVRFEYVDDSFDRDSYYYLRVTQADEDPHGNPSRAWSSPIWVKRQQ